MASVNKVIVLGNVGRDPEMRYTQAGTAVCTISLATTRNWKSKSGEKQEETEWHRVTFFDRLAEIVGEYCKKGDPLFVEGRLKTDKYEKNGADHFTTAIIAENLQLLGGRKDGERQERPQRQERAPAPAPRSKAPAGGFEDMDDDIPF
jgi:single-strand DNA-binding protein